MSLWSEIKQRRITQIVVTYLAGGWIVTSFVDQVVDREVLPLVVYQVVFTLYLFGILGALIIGWYHGEKGAQEAPPVEIAMLVVIGILAVGTSGWIVQQAMLEATVEDSLEAAGLDLRSIGVLYFEDVSRDGSGQVVADAITEGLIGALAEVSELDVTTRNAARAVQGLDIAPDSIATLLDVGTIVDGTVDQVGDELRNRSPPDRGRPMARILLADDNPVVARLVEHKLTQNGHEVEVVHDGKQAVASAGAVRPDLCILDVMMPGMDGYQVMSSLRKDENVSPTSPSSC